MVSGNEVTTAENQKNEEDEVSVIKSKLEENLRKRKHHRIEDQLLRLVELGEVDVNYLQNIAKKVIRDKYFDKLSLVFQMIMQKFVEDKKYTDALTLTRLILHEDPHITELREKVLEIVESLFKDKENYDLFLDKSRLETADDLGEALDKFEKFVYYDRGEFFIHKSWGVGKILLVDADRNRIQVDFENKGKHFINLEGAPHFLRKIPKRHFLVQEHINKDELQGLAKNEPVALIKKLLKSYKGTLKLSSIKNKLIKNIIPEKDWSKWWSTTRTKIKHDPYLDEGKGNDPLYTLRNVAVEYSDEVIEKYRKCKTLEKKYSVIKEAFKIKKNKKETLQKIKSRILEDLKEVAKEQYSVRLDLYYINKEIADTLSIKDDELPNIAEEIINSDLDIKEILFGMNVWENQRSFLIDYYNRKPELWEGFIVQIASELPQKLFEWLLKFLEKNEKAELSHNIVKTVLKDYVKSPELFAYSARYLLSDKWKVDEFDLTKFELIERVLELMNDIQDDIDSGSRDADDKKIVNRLRSILSERNYAFLINLIDNESIDDVKRLRLLLLSNRALSDIFKKSIDVKIKTRRPDTIERVAIDELKADFIYATQGAIERKKLEYERLVRVEIPQNSKEIAEAASQGDITDNAEYEAAKQKQKSLLEKIKDMERELSKIKVIIKDEVDTSNVTVGTKVKLKSVDEIDEFEYIILGPWDSLPEKNIISFLSLIGSSLLGHKVGDTVSLNIDNELSDYRIISIENGVE